MAWLANISNRELNIAATLLIDVGVTVYYLASLVALPGEVDFTSPALIAVIGKIIIASIVISIVVFSLINWRTGEEIRDERDYRFEAKANNYAYLSLVICIVLILGHVVLNEWMVAFRPDNSWSALPLSPMFIAHLLLGALLIASAIKAVTQLVLYRRYAG